MAFVCLPDPNQTSVPAAQEEHDLISGMAGMAVSPSELSELAGYLVVHSEDIEEQFIPIRPGSDVIVGRQPTCEFVLPHLAASNKHFRIYVNIYEEGVTEPLCYCEDLGSLNGTYLNGHAVASRTAVLLSQGDIISIRHSASFQFHQLLMGSQEPPKTLDHVTEREKGIFSEDYTLTPRFLGGGAYGKVYMAWDKKTRRQAACKVIGLKRSRSKSKEIQDKKLALREVKILAEISHPNVVDIRKVCATESRIYIFEELITGGDLFSYVVKQGSIPETEAMPIVWQILKGLEYLHGQGIVHRDLKPENILCASHTPGTRIILTDFGTARTFTAASRMMSALGTFEFSAPEIFTKPALGYSSSCDLWSLGVVTHVVLSGAGPFDYTGLMPSEVIQVARDCDLRHMYTSSHWKRISSLAKEFVRKLVCIDPSKRMEVAQAKQHRWLARYSSELEDLYLRSINGWTERPYTVKMEQFDINGEAEDDVDMTQGLPDIREDDEYHTDEEGQGGFFLGASSPEMPMSDWKYSSPNGRRCGTVVLSQNSNQQSASQKSNSQAATQVSHQKSLIRRSSSWIVVESRAESLAPWCNPDDQDLYDQVAGDGKLRSAAEMLRQVQARKAVMQRSSSDNFSMASEPPVAEPEERSKSLNMDETY